MALTLGGDLTLETVHTGVLPLDRTNYGNRPYQHKVTAFFN